MARRALAALAVLLGVLLLPAAPARADALPVTVAEVKPGEVSLLADVPGTVGNRITVTRDGWLLPVTVTPAEAADRSTVVVVDTAAGMAGTPMRAIRSGLLALADAAPADVAVGLVTTGGEPAVLLRPTRDRTALRTAVSGLRAGGRDALGAGLRAAVALGPGGPGSRLLVVAGGRQVAAAGSVAVPAGSPVDLVALGGDPTGTPLGRVARGSGGAVRTVDEAARLTGALRAVATGYPRRMVVTVTVGPELAGTTAALTVTAAGTRTEVPVRFAAAPATASTAPTLAGLPVPRPTLLAVLIFVALLVAVLLTVTGAGGSVRRGRIEQVERFRLPDRGPRPDGGDPPARPESGLTHAVLGLSERVVRGGGREERIAQRLDRAGMTVRPAEWTAVRGTAVFLGAVLLGLLAGFLGALAGALLGWLGTLTYRRLREERRRRSFADQLPDALHLVVGSLRSGFSLAQSIDGVVRDSPPGPLTVELGRAMAEVRLGSDLDDALGRAAARVGNDDLAWVVMAVRIQRETGGNLAEVLETTVETLRERDRLRRHVRALSAEGRLSAYILVALPIVLAGWMLLVRREYLSPLWTTPAGLVMLVGAVVLMLVGAFWMARWVKVEV
ncbi:type II secretion system F family protein [Micromonospora mirobrigensis]|uniref:type II secretion system F family protein n=1 Tax=Micromonospora mirobrigensis TaxID=262898 RepID=UPI00114CE19C|nr:type II secretion system F family protein [Micromonospora mirobrigensis]